MDASGTDRLIRAGGLSLSALGLGTAPLGGMFAPVSDDDVLSTVDAAFTAGMAYFDTAPQYGWGLAEQRIGDALRGRDRNSYVLSTKVGRLLRGANCREDGDIFVGARPATATFDYSRDGILRSFEKSLGRLGLDRVDIAYVHDPDDHHAQARDEAIPALVRLRDEGVISAVGVGMNSSEPLAAFVRDSDIDIVLCAGRYSLLDQQALPDLLPLCTRRGVAVVIGGVFNSGILADPVPGATFDYRPAPMHLLARAQRLATICRRHEVPLTAAAVQFPFGHPAVRSVLIGARSAAEVTADTAALATSIPPSMWQEMVDAGLLGPEVPTPAAQMHRFRRRAPQA